MNHENGKQKNVMRVFFILVNRMWAVCSTVLVLFENCQQLIVGKAQE